MRYCLNSPDGKWCASSCEYSADSCDVYRKLRTGGMPKRLTVHPALDLFIGWTPDGQYILFTSSRHDWN